MKKVAVLSTAITDQNIDISTEFVRRLNQSLPDHSFSIIFYKDLVFKIVDGVSSVVDSVSGQDLKDFDRAYVKSWYRFDETATAIANYLQLHNVPFDPEELGVYRSRTKVSETFIMNKLGAPIPNTLYVVQPAQEKVYLSEEMPLSYPVVIKVVDGGSGRLNFLCNNKEELREVLAANPDDDFIMNEFIENKFDYRVLIMDGVIKLVIKRQRVDEDSHMNNTSQGADAEVMPVDVLPKDIQDMSIGICKHMKRTVSGVDVLVASDGRHVFLEVNKSPQITSGAAQSEKSDLFTEYFRNKLS
jgi:glutathione synthase/RimK-type ligase-like ATP-grasp enzyme